MERLTRDDAIAIEKRSIIIENVQKCCGNCYYFGGEIGDNEQFCDETEK